MLKQRLFSLYFVSFFVTFWGCGGNWTKAPTKAEPTGPEKQQKIPRPLNPPQIEQPEEPIHEIGQQELVQKYGFTIRANQSIGDELPPQPGQIVHGKTVRGGPNADTNWSAFTLVLFKDGKGYKILTQKRAHSHAGTIETPGGHLLGGQTWRDGAQDELEQEAGIRVQKEFLIFLQGGQPRLSRTQRLYGNANFFVVFNGQPQTSNFSGEVDTAYGHQWLDLKHTYEEVLAENNNDKFAHGKYYSFFRGHLLTFCSQVLDCSKL